MVKYYKYYKKTLLVKTDWSRFMSIRDNWKILLSALNWNDKIISVQSDQIEFIQKEPLPSGRVDGTLNFYAGGLPFWHPTCAENACREQWLGAILAIKRSAGVIPEGNLR